MTKPRSDKAAAAAKAWGARLKAWNEEAKLAKAGFVALRCTGFKELVVAEHDSERRVSGLATFNDQVKRRFRYGREMGLALLAPDPEAEKAIRERLDDLHKALDTH